MLLPDSALLPSKQSSRSAWQGALVIPRMDSVFPSLSLLWVSVMSCEINAYAEVMADPSGTLEDVRGPLGPSRGSYLLLGGVRVSLSISSCFSSL